MEYVFTLKYQLSAENQDMDLLVEHLGEAGCDDALIGVGQPCRLALEFVREASSAKDALNSAMTNIRNVMPSARLIEVTPDLMGLTDVAEIVGVPAITM